MYTYIVKGSIVMCYYYILYVYPPCTKCSMAFCYDAIWERNAPVSLIYGKSWIGTGNSPILYLFSPHLSFLLTFRQVWAKNVA